MVRLNWLSLLSPLYKTVFQQYSRTVGRLSLIWLPNFSYDIGLNNFVEPNNIVYNLEMPFVDHAVVQLRGLLKFDPKEHLVTRRAREKRIHRLGLLNDAVREAVSVNCFFRVNGYWHCVGSWHTWNRELTWYSLEIRHLCHSLSADSCPARHPFDEGTSHIFFRKNAWRSPKHCEYLKILNNIFV